VIPPSPGQEIALLEKVKSIFDGSLGTRMS